MRWLINVPVWGERYRRNFVELGLPSIEAALRVAGATDYRFLLQTDAVREMACALSGPVGMKIHCRDVPPGKNAPEQLGNAVRIGLAHAKPGEAVMFFNADMVISRETFAACERRFDEGKKFVTCHSVRAVDNSPPLGAASRVLLDWGWSNRHRWVDDCVFGRGRVAGPAIVVFDNGEDVVAHCFSLQCLAVHKTREIDFTGPTADELVDCFTRDEVHVVTDADELACVEPCPPDMAYDLRGKALDAKFILDFAEVYASNMMAWQFRHQVVIRGRHDAYADAIANRIVDGIDSSKHPARLVPYTQARDEAAAAIAGVAPNYRWLTAKLILSWVPRPIRHLVPRPIRLRILRWI